MAPIDDREYGRVVDLTIPQLYWSRQLMFSTSRMDPGGLSWLDDKSQC